MPFEYEDKSKFEYEDSSSKEANKVSWKTPNWVKVPVAAGEAALTMIGGLPSQIVGGLSGLGHLVTGSGIDKAAKVSEDIQKWNFGAGQYQGSTELGKQYSQNLSEAFAAPGEYAGDLGAAIGKQVGKEDLGRLSLQLPTDVLMNFLPLGAVAAGAKGVAGKAVKSVKPKAKGSPRLEYLDEAPVAEKPIDLSSIDPGLLAGIDNAQVARLEAALSKRNVPQDTIHISGEGRKYTPEQVAMLREADSEMGASLRATEAQRALDARQAALEQEVAQRQSLDFNAAERARQLNAPTGAAQHIFEQGRREFETAYAEMQKAQQDAAIAEAQAKQAKTDAELLAAGKRQRDAQAALERRQAELEYEVRRQQQLQAMAAERARQERAPVTSPEMMRDLEARNAAEIQASIDKTQELNTRGQQMGIVEDYGNNDPMSRMPEMRVDENGIPIRADLSMEAQNLENPLQRNLWGDELGPALGQKRSLTEAIDAMPDSHAKDMALSQLTGQQPPRSTMMKKDFWSGKGGKQRGAIDPTDFVKAANKIKQYVNDLSNIKLDTLAPKQVDDYARQIPGMGNKLDAVIIKPKIDLEQALNTSKDIPDSFKPSVASGPSMTAEKYKNPVVKHVAGLLTWRDKKADLAQTRLVKPLERQLNSLSKVEQTTLADAMREEMFSNTRYTDEQLLAAGVSKKGLDSYKKLRDQLDAVYELQAQKLRDLGKDVPTKQEAHLASLRNGPWHVVVKGQDGRPWHIATSSKYEANKAVKWINENLKGENLKVEIDYRGSNNVKGVPQDIMGGYQDILRLMDEEPGDAGLVVKEAIRSAQEKAGYEYQRQSDRFKRKNNFRGFEGDMPWLDNKENAARLLQAQVDYLNNAYSWSYLQDALKDIKDVMSNERFLKEQPIAAEYLKDIVNLQTGQGTHALKAAEDWIGKKLGFSGAGVREAFGKSNSATSLLLLGGSPGYMLQAPLSALHALSLHVKEGSMSPRAALVGLQDGIASVLSDLGHNLGAKGDVPMTELGKAARKYGEENGIWTKHMFGDMDKLTQNQTMNSYVLEPLATTIQTPEKLQRAITFFGFVHGLEATGKYSNMYDLFQRAEDLTELAATNFRRHEIPLAVQETGVGGQMLFKFKAPTLNYFHQLHMNLRDMQVGSKESRRKAALAFTALLGTTAFLGGMESLPGMQEMDGAMELAKGAVASISPEAYAKIRDVSVKEFIRENFGLAAARGAVEAATGAAMQSRFGTDVIDLENPLGSMPVVSTAQNVGKAAVDLAKGNPQQAAWRVLPPAARGNLEVSSDAFETLGGQRRPSNISDPAVALTRSEADKTYRRFGLRSSEEALQLENSYRSQQQAKRDKDVSESLVNSVVNSVLSGNEEKLAASINTWMEINPGQDIKPQLASKIMDASVPPDVKQLMAAKSLRAIERAMKAREFAER